MTVPGEPPASQSLAAVRASGLRKVYGTGETAVHALRGVDVTFARGEFTAIMGPSGSGKSTLMHCLAGLDTATAGQVWLGDTELTSLRDDQLTTLRRKRVGFVFQSFNLLPVLDAMENITLPMQLAGQRPDRTWLDAAIARALLPRPDVVFADEPTGNLDSRSGAEVLGLLRSSVKETGQTVVMVTHDPVGVGGRGRVV